MFLDIWRRVTNWFRSRSYRSKTKAAPPPMIEASHVETAPLADPPPTYDHAAQYYEKQRRKHDKFVKPNGELPERQPRQRTQEVKPRTPKPGPESTYPKNIDPNPPPIPTSFDGYVVDQHHEGGPEVLYKGEELLGEFNFRDTILEQLDRYFFYLKRMRRYDNDAFGLYSQIGATILPYLATGAWNRNFHAPLEKKPIPPLPPWFNATRPGFGCYAYGTDPETEKYEQAFRDDDHPKTQMWVPKFMYFQKYKTPPVQVEHMSGEGDIYKLTVWWDRPSKKFRHGIPQSIPIFISADGRTVKALKTLKTSWIPVPSKRFSIPSRQWQIPSEYKEWAKQFEEDVHHFLATLFIDLIAQAEHSHMSLIRIAVTKNHMTATFSVNISRTAYFFQDRDISVTQSGTRKPVFHQVRPHIRKDGTAVRMHFRGLREFTWAGYDVRITVPGLDHADINEFDIGVVDDKTLTDEEKAEALTQTELGTKLADHIRHGWASGVTGKSARN